MRTSFRSPLDKIKRVRIHASFTREFLWLPTLLCRFSLFFFFFFFLLFRFTSRHQRSGQIRIHCRISPGTFAPKRGNCLPPRPPTSLNREKTNEETDRNQEPELLRISYNFSWFLLLPPSLGISISSGSTFRKNSWKRISKSIATPTTRIFIPDLIERSSLAKFRYLRFQFLFILFSLFSFFFLRV